MYSFSRASKRNLAAVDYRLQVLMEAVVQTLDISITSGLRSTEQQQDLYKKGVTTKDGVNNLSMHQLGLAVDFCAYGNTASFKGIDNSFIAGFIYATALQMKINIRCGARWDNKLCSDATLFDPYHIEIVE